MDACDDHQDNDDDDDDDGADDDENDDDDDDDEDDDNNPYAAEGCGGSGFSPALQMSHQSSPVHRLIKMMMTTTEVVMMTWVLMTVPKNLQSFEDV